MTDDIRPDQLVRVLAGVALDLMAETEAFAGALRILVQESNISLQTRKQLVSVLEDFSKNRNTTLKRMRDLVELLKDDHSGE